MDDFVLNVRQIAQYPESQPQPDDTVLIQQGGIGGSYASTTVADLVAAGAGQSAPSAMNPPPWPGQLFTDVISTTLEGAIGFNLYWTAQAVPLLKGIGPALSIYQDPGSGALNFDMAPVNQAGTSPDFDQVMVLGADGTLATRRVTIAATPAGPADAVNVDWINRQAVRSFNGRFGSIVLNVHDIMRGGGAPICNAELQGQPLAPTADSACRHQVANVEFVERTMCDWINGLLNEHPFVWTFNGRRGDIWLTQDDLTEAAYNDPLNPPQVPTAPPGTATDQAASTLFVANGLEDLQTWVENELATSGDVTIAYLEANYAPLASPTLTGFPSAPTAAPGTSTGQLATTAFVMAAITESTTGVASFNSRTGAVVLTEQDLTDVGAATLNSPVFTGAPTAPNPPGPDSSGRLATTSWVSNNTVLTINGRNGTVSLNVADLASMGGAPLLNPALTGVPTAPTATPGSATQQLANTAFVAAAITAAGGVASFNSRTGAVTLQSNDLSAAGGALLAGPAFTGIPTAPTPATSDNGTRLATTAFVQALIAGAGGVTSFNGRGGAITLTAADLVAASPAALRGVTDGSNAPPGAIGEFMSNAAGGLSFPTAIWGFICAITLTAGDWDVWANASFSPTTAASYVGAALSTTASSANIILGSSFIASLGGSPILGQSQGNCPPTRINVTANQVISLLGIVTYASGSVTIQGNLWARRVR